MATLVSVIVPVYNASPYLRQCLDSIVNQTLKDIEIICVNGDSTDDSLDILMQYAKKDVRLHVLQQKNRGAGLARNSAIQVARGDFLAFMDSDDFYPSKYSLEHMYGAACENNALICGGNVTIVDSDGNIINQNHQETEFIESKNILYEEYQSTFGFWRFIYSRNLIVTNEIVFPDLRRGEDPLFFVNAMLVANSFYALAETTYCWRTGHKKVILTNENALSYLDSQTELMKLSCKHNFAKMHISVIIGYILNYPSIIKQNSNDMNYRIKCESLNQMINYNLLNEINVSKFVQFGLSHICSINVAEEISVIKYYYMSSICIFISRLLNHRYVTLNSVT